MGTNRTSRDASRSPASCGVAVLRLGGGGGELTRSGYPGYFTRTVTGHDVLVWRLPLGTSPVQVAR